MPDIKKDTFLNHLPDIISGSEWGCSICHSKFAGGHTGIMAIECYYCKKFFYVCDKHGFTNSKNMPADMMAIGSGVCFCCSRDKKIDICLT